MHVSKTDYITYLKHPVWLWLRKHDPDFLPTPDDNSQAIIDEGREFEKLAEQIFPEAIRLDRNDYADMQEWADETKALLELRHTVATQLKDNGVPPKEAQAILGHSSIITTLEIHTRVSR